MLYGRFPTTRSKPYSPRISLTIVARLSSRKSAWMMSIVAFSGLLSALASVRSISMANNLCACAAKGNVNAPRPGPISRIWSVAFGAIAVTTFLTHGSSRKCWPNRRLGRRYCWVTS